MNDYESFVADKLAHHVSAGLTGELTLPVRAFPFQRDLVTLRGGQMRYALAFVILTACGGETVAPPTTGSCCSLPGVFDVTCFWQEPWLYEDGGSCMDQPVAKLGTKCVWCPPDGGGMMIGEVAVCGQ